MSGGGNLERILRLMAEKKASDVFLSARTPILIKISGQILALTDQPLTPSQPRQLLSEMVSRFRFRWQSFERRNLLG